MHETVTEIDSSLKMLPKNDGGCPLIVLLRPCSLAVPTLARINIRHGSVLPDCNIANVTDV